MDHRSGGIPGRTLHSVIAQLLEREAALLAQLRGVERDPLAAVAFGRCPERSVLMRAMNFMHITLHVTDLERSIAFYELLGFQVIFQPNRHRATTMPVFELNDQLEFGGGHQQGVIMSLGDHPRATTLLVLVQFIDPPATPKPFKPKHEAGTHRIALRVKDLDGLLAELRAQGIEIADEPIAEVQSGLRGGLKMRWTLLPDPDDNLIELMEYERM